MLSDLIIRGRVSRSDPETPLAEAILVAAETLDIWECFVLADRYHFALGEGWTLALSLDSADRIRVETCRLTRPVNMMWALSHRSDRLAGLVRKMSTVPIA